jgi:hypothetical protein
MQKLIGCGVDEDFWQEIADIAQAQDRSIASLVRLALREYLDKRKRGNSDGDDEPTP